jgi:hypothetical protein
MNEITVKVTAEGNPVPDARISVGDKPAGTTDQDGLRSLKLEDGYHVISATVLGVRQQHTFKVPRILPAYIKLKIRDSSTAAVDAYETVEEQSAANGVDFAAGVQFLLDRQAPGEEEMTVQEAQVIVNRLQESGQLEAFLKKAAYLQNVEEPKASIVSEDIPMNEIDKPEEQKDPSVEESEPENDVVASAATRRGAAAPPTGNNGDPPTGNNNIGGSLLDPNVDLPTLSVALTGGGVSDADEGILNTVVRARTSAIGFNRYAEFIDAILCVDNSISGQNSASINRQKNELFEPIHGAGAYELLKTATQVFLLLECGPVLNRRDRRFFDGKGEERRLGRKMSFDEAIAKLGTYLGGNRLPYIERVLNTAFAGRADQDNNIFCEGYLGARADCPPMLELIWSYWHEEAMLVQSMNAISLRFQNRRSKGDRDPLANLEIAPLYPLNNLLWGYLQDDLNRLSVARRNYEYSHHYGLSLYGRALSDFRPADPRSRFLEGFHNLLYRTTLFYKQEDDVTYQADAFPVLNAIREVHLELSAGQHNQFGDMPWQARAEMLMEQWILARPEMRLFLQGRDMVPYQEPWMPQVDSMKQIQNWTNVTVSHFNRLAVFGEQLLLSIRYGDWVDVNDPIIAADWANYWRPEIQNYIHSYRAATGVDLAADTAERRQARLMVTQPSVLLQRRLSDGKKTPSNGASVPTSSQRFRERRVARSGSNGRK